MTSDRSSARRSRIAHVVHALALATTLAAATPRVAFAQTDTELKAARELFQEAFKDEQEKRYDVALEKFRRVAEVKESAAVRYRIASVLEALGRLREARETFQAIADDKDRLASSELAIAKSAGERAAALDKRLTRLTLSIQDPPADLKVTVDGQEIAKPQEGPIVLDPGEHVVVATSSGARPFESRVKLAEGGEVTLGISLESRAAPDPHEPSTPPPAEERKPDRTLAIVSLAGGGALVVLSGVLLAVREGKIGDLEEACPNNVCPTARRDELEGTRDDAQLLRPLAIGSAVLGVAAAGVGAYLLLKPAPPAPAASDEPKAAARDRARRAPVVFAGGPTPGGALFGLRGAF